MTVPSVPLSSSNSCNEIALVTEPGTVLCSVTALTWPENRNPTARSLDDHGGVDWLLLMTLRGRGDIFLRDGKPDSCFDTKVFFQGELCHVLM